MKALLTLGILLTLTRGSPSWGLTVEEAYQAVPHKRTPYEAQLSTLGPPEREFLSRFFVLSDQALVERVETLKALRAGNRLLYERYEANIARILTGLRLLQEPASARGLSEALSRAIEHQRAFFRKWNTAAAAQRAFSFPAGETPTGIDPSIRQANEELQRLYADLLSRYGTEHPHNREAFYQYLCALDFL